MDLTDASKWQRIISNTSYGVTDPDKPWMKNKPPAVFHQVNSYIIAVKVNAYSDESAKWFLGGAITRGYSNLVAANPSFNFDATLSPQYKLQLNKVNTFTFSNDGILPYLIKITFPYWFENGSYIVWEYQADNPLNPYGIGQFNSSPSVENLSYNGGTF